jgi:hypothetical protein
MLLLRYARLKERWFLARNIVLPRTRSTSFSLQRLVRCFENSTRRWLITTLVRNHPVRLFTHRYYNYATLWLTNNQELEYFSESCYTLLSTLVVSANHALSAPTSMKRKATLSSAHGMIIILAWPRSLIRRFLSAYFYLQADPRYLNYVSLYLQQQSVIWQICQYLSKAAGRIAKSSPMYPLTTVN